MRACGEQKKQLVVQMIAGVGACTDVCVGAHCGSFVLQLTDCLAARGDGATGN